MSLRIPIARRPGQFIYKTTDLVARSRSAVIISSHLRFIGSQSSLMHIRRQTCICLYVNYHVCKVCLCMCLQSNLIIKGLKGAKLSGEEDPSIGDGQRRPNTSKSRNRLGCSFTRPASLKSRQRDRTELNNICQERMLNQCRSRTCLQKPVWSIFITPPRGKMQA